MFILGLVLIFVALLLILLALLAAGVEAKIDLGWIDVGNVSLTLIFMLGMVAMLLLVIGIWVLRRGVASAFERRKDRKEVSRLKSKIDELEEGEKPEAPAATPEA